MRKKLELAKIFSEIHSYTFFPFYEEVKSDFWDRLPEKSTNLSEQLDKDFFIRMALYVCELLKDENNEKDFFAKTLYEIHSSCLTPFYMSKEELDKFKNDKEDFWHKNTWENLPFDLHDKEKVDKGFFIKMGKYVMDKVKL